MLNITQKCIFNPPSDTQISILHHQLDNCKLDNYRHRHRHTHTHTHTQPFDGRWSGTTWVGRYQKKHSPTHNHPDHQTYFINFLHLLWSVASSLFSLHAWQSFSPISPSPLWSWTLYFILNAFLHQIIIFFSQLMPIPSQPVLITTGLPKKLYILKHPTSVEPFKIKWNRFYQMFLDLLGTKNRL